MLLREVCIIVGIHYILFEGTNKLWKWQKDFAFLHHLHMSDAEGLHPLPLPEGLSRNPPICFNSPFVLLMLSNFYWMEVKSHKASFIGFYNFCCLCIFISFKNLIDEKYGNYLQIKKN